MRYIPPARLFGDAFQPPFDKKAVQRERKKLLAELELSGGEGLELKGHRLTRNEIIDYFDELQLDAIADYHTAIAEDGVLLAFLSDGRIDEGTSFSDVAIYFNYGFITWVSPYFYQAFTTVAANCLESKDEIAMKTLLENRMLMTDEDKERAWLFIAKVLTRNIALFDAFHGKGKRFAQLPMPFEQIIDFVSHEYIRVIERLPDTRFGQIKDMYAFSIQHPAIAAFNRNGAYRAASINWIEDAKYLAVSMEIKARIGEKLEELEGITKRSKKGRPWAAVWIIVVVIKLLTLLPGSSRDNSLDNINSSRVHFNFDSGQKRLLIPSGSHIDTVYVGDTTGKQH